jgi:hypothetical protein
VNAAAIHEEVAKQVGGFMEIMKSQPLSLALVVMNFALVAFLFYSNAQVLEQRGGALNRIVEWQQKTDVLMASCVSIEVMKLVVDALERDRNLYRQMLPPLTPAPPPATFPPEGPKLQSGTDRPATPEEIENLFKMPP